MQSITPYHAKYFSNYLTRRLPANSLDKLTASLQGAQVDLTPHQIDAALFAFKSPLSNGAVLADEVGLGKTIEAGIILSQHWAEHKRTLLIICPANFRKQWSAELMEKFFLPSYILESGIELGNHAYTHCYPRLKKVTDGIDQGGISKTQNWKGGSGFKFYELAPSLLKEDKFGNLVINKDYNADMLAAAMAKQEGYTYQPDTTLYWKQGQSSEHDYIYTTTQFLTVESLDAISETMQEGESLLICCTAFQKECATHHPNITVKKIPQMLLGRCEFNKDNYNLNIIDMPKMDEEEDFDLPENDAQETENNKKQI